MRSRSVYAIVGLFVGALVSFQMSPHDIRPLALIAVVAWAGAIFGWRGNTIGRRAFAIVFAIIITLMLLLAFAMPPL